ncbi:MAG: CPBP family intramembrane metalloprotease [Acidobacteria bacterium]|nr:CPBP family intramembrane metalloprotease [Acidobacteriota bacterium]
MVPSAYPIHPESMDGPPHARRPWAPDRAWADPAIALLALLALLLSGLTLARRVAPRPGTGVTLQGRLLELPTAAEHILGSRGSLLPPLGAPSTGAGDLIDPWDRALLGILEAERGEVVQGRRLAFGDLPEGPTADSLRIVWDYAYGGGRPPLPEDRFQAGKALGRGWGAALLEARVLRRLGMDDAPVLAEATRSARVRLLALGAGGSVLVLGGLGGLGVGVLLLLHRKKVPPPPSPPALHGRALLLALLVWYLALLLSSSFAGAVIHRLPSLSPYALTLAYGFHASVGILLLLRVEGLGLRAFLARTRAPDTGRAAAWGLAYLALAIPLLLFLAILLAPLTRGLGPPQRELLDHIAGLRTPLPLFFTFLTVAVAAPAFEEFLFRGMLLPWMADRWGWLPGLLASGALFGSIHLQPGGLPALMALGVLLGSAARRGGGLLSPLLFHALWNGGIFLFMRLLVA